MPDFSHSAVHQFWRDYQDTYIYRVVAFMEGVEDWSVDGDTRFEASLTQLGEALDDIGNIELKAEDKIIQICKKYNIDLISLARYMRILSPNFVWRYPNRVINIHPSLLPAFPGASAYEQAFERGTKIVGVTSHYVTENLDQGPIIFQDSFKVDPNETLEKMKSKGQKLEADTLVKAMKMHLENKLEVRWRKVHIKSK